MKIILLIPFILLFSACKSKKIEYSKKIDGVINYNGIYVSRDTLPPLDRKFKREITIRLMKFNKDQSVQMSNSYIYYQGDSDNLNNSTILKWLHDFTSYNFAIKSKTKLNISCYAKHKTPWYDFATSNKTIINENFTVKGDTLFRITKFSRNFDKIYVLDKTLTTNHTKIGQGNACQ